MNIFVILWTVLIFASVAWYGLLLFYVGYKGGKEIRRMTHTLDERNINADAGQKS
jgi:hypothetical protein